ncbi:MinD/ParA family protein [Pectinatus frisingensis]|uniref:MinD/ParA family protein n=1 Tax=Pectinatus frisingensis TaxID=865 RepID=UPI0018C5174A|nr:MinD/ParA family protein [Pectinatus frisingensis]
MKDQAAKLRQLVGGKNFVGDLQETGSVNVDKKDNLPYIIAITSGKGGVGKTNFTVNLAIALSRMGKRVLIIDADLGLANVEVILGCSSRYTMMDLLNSDISLAQIILEGPAGIKYISGGSGIEQMSDLSVTTRELLIQKLYACETVADIILVDTGAGVGRNVLDFLLSSDEIILLTTPEPTALTDAYAVIKACRAKTDFLNIKFVINKIYDESEGIDVGMKLIETTRRFLQVNVSYLGMIYDDRNMTNAIKKQVPLLLSYPDTIAAKCINSIAKAVLQGDSMRVKRGWRGFLQRLIFSR